MSLAKTAAMVSICGVAHLELSYLLHFYYAIDWHRRYISRASKFILK